MAKLDRNSLLKHSFKDPKNYPYGFARSGDFSIRESQCLQQYGRLYAALVDGELAPENQADHHFLATAHGDAEANTPELKAWMKYQTRINRPKAGSFYGSNKVALDEESDHISEDTNIEVVYDDED